MKQGILIYTPEDAARNRWFIGALCRYAEPEGMSLRLVLSDDAQPMNAFSPEDSFLINRSRICKYSSYAEESLQIPCFNSKTVTGITNDKYLTFCFLHGKHGIPMAETKALRPHELLPALQYPVVAKPPDGHGGAGVAWIRNADELRRYSASAAAADANAFLVQEPVVTGWDVRVYVLGGEIYAAVLRTSDSDFRSNFSLGGHAALIEPDAQMRTLVQRVQAVMPLDFAGVDILKRADGSYLIGEIEDAVGCRMLYQLTDKDPARDYMQYIGRNV